MAEAITVTGLRKSFGHTRALDGLDLAVNAGEVHGFLGPNAAGKTTTLRILLGLLRGDAGTVRLLGGDPWREATALHRRLAYVPGDVTSWPELSGGEVIDLLGRLRGGLDAGRRAQLRERFELDPTRKTGTYSKGHRQKVAIVAALASNVELLILDEPTSGLDPLMEAVFRECIAEERRRGCTILLSSHILAEVEALCDRVTIIRAGRVVESGSLADLRQLTRISVSAELTRPPTGLTGVHDLVVEGTRLRCHPALANGTRHAAHRRRAVRRALPRHRLRGKCRAPAIAMCPGARGLYKSVPFCAPTPKGWPAKPHRTCPLWFHVARLVLQRHFDLVQRRSDLIWKPSLQY